LKVKICGIRRYEDAREALDAGAWALGFIFHKRSPRHVDPEEARRILERLPRGVLSIGVFVDRSVEEVNRTVEAVGLRGAQLHGKEDLAYAKQVKAAVVIKSLRVGPAFRARQVLLYPGSRILLDTYRAGVAGGTGATLDWTVARKAADLVPIILAGGIGPENAAEAVAKVHPYALDVSSGVEASPGIKDREKIRELFRAL